MKKSALFFAVVLFMTAFSPSIIAQSTTGQKASLNEDGSIFLEPIQLDINDMEPKSNFEILEGFPFGSPANPSFKNFRGAAIGDIDADGQDEIIFGANSKLIALKGNGQVLWTKNLSGTIIYPPSIADMDGDEQMEIIINTGGSPNAGRVYLLDSNGNDLPGWPMNFDQHWMFNAPAIADIDGDDVMEVITCERGNSSSGFLHVIKMDGTPLNENWPTELPGNLAFTPSIGDIDNNGIQDIVISISSGSLYALNPNAEILTGFPLVETNKSYSYQSPILFDFNGDDHLEIVGARHGDVPDYYMVKSDGTYADGWPVTSPPGWRYSPTTIVDSDGDDVYEIYVGHPNTNGNLPLDVMFGFDANGSLLDNFPINKVGGCEGVISVADVNNDDVMDLIFTNNTTDAFGMGFIHAYSLDGSGEIEGFPLRPKGFTFINSAVLGDIDGDELLDISCLSYTQFTGNDSIFMTSYNLGVPYDPTKILANGYKGNQRRDGHVDMDINIGIVDQTINSVHINVSPNPSSDRISIELSRSVTFAKVELINYLGAVLESTHLDHSSRLDMNIAHLPAGNYIIRIENEGRLFHEKWIKL